MIRAMKMRMGSTTQVYIVESKNAGIAISLMPPYDGQEESIYLLSCTTSSWEWEYPVGAKAYALFNQDDKNQTLWYCATITIRLKSRPSEVKLQKKS